MIHTYHMPSIQLTDNASLDLTIPPGVKSAFSKYLKNPKLILQAGPDLSKEIKGPLDQASVQSLAATVTFQDQIGLGTGGSSDLNIEAGTTGVLEVYAKTGVTVCADQGQGGVVVQAGEAYAGGTFTARVDVGVSSTPGDLCFGFDSNASVDLRFYERFETQPAAPALGEALQAALRDFTIPADLDDLANMPEGSIASVAGHGKFGIKGGFSVSLIPNPLAIPDLPPAVDLVQLNAGASIGVTASASIGGDYEIRVRKTNSRSWTLSYHKGHQGEWSLALDAQAGVSAGLGQPDLIADLLKAISPDPEADQKELLAAGLTQQQIGEIADGIKAGVKRTLAVSLDAAVSLLRGNEAAFAYEFDLAALDEEGRTAVHAALDGDLSALTAREDELQEHGIRLVRSVLKETRGQSVKLTLNLLGILNYVSIAKLLVESSVMADPQSGDLTITDRATATKLRALLANFEQNANKIRSLYFAATVATVTYRASGLLQPVNLDTKQTFFELHASTNSQQMERELNAVQAFGLITAQDKTAYLGNTSSFGRCTLLLESAYDDSACRAIFLDAAGNPKPNATYESEIRAALLALIETGYSDAYRRIPMEDDALWNQMKAAGSFQAVQDLLKRPIGDDVVQLNVVYSDYLTVVFWADRMAVTAQKLNDIIEFLNRNPGVDRRGNDFNKRRKDLANHLAKVAADSQEKWGDPWGPLALLRSSPKATTRVILRSAAFTLAKSNPTNSGGIPRAT